MEQRRDVAESRHVRELVVDVVAEAGSVDDGKSDTDAILVELWCASAPCQRHELRLDLPTLTGLILMPSSMWAMSGLSETLWARTSLSQSVFTNVVRPVPDAPVRQGHHYTQHDTARQIIRIMEQEQEEERRTRQRLIQHQMRTTNRRP